MKFTFFIIILAAIVAAVAYGSINWQKYGNILGKKQDIALIDLMKFANLNDGKNFCTKGYLIQFEGITVLKTTADNDLYKQSVWINNVSGKSFFVDALGDNKAAGARVCGKFESGRGMGFGQPSIWNQQISVQSFEITGEVKPLNN